MDRQEMKDRTKRYAVNVVRFSRTLPRDVETYIIKKQIIRSATSVMANYRACCRSKSHKDFINKLFIVLEEADETMCWLEVLVETDIIK